MQLRCKPDLEIPYALFDIVLREFISDPFERKLTLHDGDRVAKSGQIFSQILVAILEHCLSKTFFRVAWQLDIILFRQLDQGRWPNRTIEMHMEICLR